MTFFAVIGLVVCTLMALFMLTILFFFWKVRRSFRELSEMVETGMPFMQMATPARVHLQPREKINWLDEDKANTLLQGLWRLGFQDSGSYEMNEIPGLKLRALARPEDYLWAVVYEHPLVGQWMDIVTRYADGGGHTTSNTALGSELEARPGHVKSCEPDGDAEVLYHRHLAERRVAEMKPVVPENFPAEFEKAYGDEMDWRLSRGMSTDEELRAIAANSGKVLSDEELELLRETQQAQASVALSEAIRERFLEQTPLSAAEWEKLRNRIVIVHDRMPPESVLAEFEAWHFDEIAEFGEEAEENLRLAYPPGLTPCQGFEHLNSTLSAARRFERIAHFAEPVPASIYRAAPTALNHDTN